MLAAAYLAVTRAEEAKKKGGPPAQHDDKLIPLSANEIRRLLAHTVLAPAHRLAHLLRWSHWRRHRQHQARTCHYRRRGHRPP